LSNACYNAASLPIATGRFFSGKIGQDFSVTNISHPADVKNAYSYTREHTYTITDYLFFRKENHITFAPTFTITVFTT
jgi:hypothetical protein